MSDDDATRLMSAEQLSRVLQGVAVEPQERRAADAVGQSPQVGVPCVGDTHFGATFVGNGDAGTHRETAQAGPLRASNQQVARGNARAQSVPVADCLRSEMRGAATVKTKRGHALWTRLFERRLRIYHWAILGIAVGLGGAAVSAWTLPAHHRRTHMHSSALTPSAESVERGELTGASRVRDLGEPPRSAPQPSPEKPPSHTPLAVEGTLVLMGDPEVQEQAIDLLRRGECPESVSLYGQLEKQDGAGRTDATELAASGEMVGGWELFRRAAQLRCELEATP